MADDLQLWERTRSGDAEAFGDLYERHARAVQSYCLWRTADLQAAEDATATVFLEAWRKRRRLTLTTGSAAPLLLGIANNVVRRQWRSQRRYRDTLERVRNVGQAPDDLETEAIARVDAIQQLREGSEAIRALPRREREVLAMLAWSDLSYGEIAAALGLPVGTVRSRLARARSRLGDAFPDLTAATRPAEESP
ncbi:MAG TPA: sigma-70 family RNA polymerase sigma factor [Solirubrobacterales bacterium]|nr:sigma-70 family RNA polymerase sigma factor [Solirubrobacterales bacterium]